MRKYSYASKNPSVTAKKHSPNVFLNAAFKSLSFVSYQNKKDDFGHPFLFGARNGTGSQPAGFGQSWF